MKKMYSVLVLAGLCFLAAPTFAATANAHSVVKASVAASTESASIEAGKTAEAEWNNLSAKEKRTKRKEVKQAVKAAMANAAAVETLLLVILAILLPPLAMAIYDGITKRFWISLILTILGYLPGLIYTLVVILGGK